MAGSIAEDVKEPVEAETTPTEASTEENKTSADNSNDDELVLDFSEEPDELTKEEESSSEEKPSETTESKEKSTRADERKKQLTNEIRDKVAERNALREEIAELSRQKYGLKSAQDLPTIESLVDQINPATGDYYTRAEAENLRLSQRLDAMEQKQEFDNYVERVTDNLTQLSNEANQVIKDFPLFDPESDQYNAELTEAADKLMQESLVTDEKTGQVIGARVSPYQLYSTIAKAKVSGEVKGKTSGRKAALDMMNNADVGGSVNAPSSKDDDDDFLSGLMS